MQRDLLIEAEMKAGDSGAARQMAKETLRLAPTDLAAREALRAAPQSAAYWINQSLSEYQQGQYLLAIASAHRGLEIDPRSAAAYNNIGASYGAMGEWKPAVENERLALKYDPQFTVARNNLALFLQRKQPEGAGGWKAQSVSRLINVSLQEYQAGNYEGCVRSAQAALKIDPRSAAAWNNIAAAHAAMQQWQEAAVAAERAIGLRPDFVLARNNLAWAESHLKKSAQ